MLSSKDKFKIAFEDGTQHRTDYKAYYRLYYEIVNGEEIGQYETTGEVPQSFLNLFNPTLREFKIKMIMNDKEDTTQTIFEHSI